MNHLALNTRIFCLSMLLIFVAALSADGQTPEWNQWRGPGRDGSVRSFTPPARWPERLILKWKVPVGGGYSSPVVSSSLVYVHSRRDEEEVVECLDLITGKPKWSKSYPVAFAKNQYAVAMGKGPNSTPLLSGGKLFTLSVNAILSCFDANSGELKWRKDFSSSVDTSKLFCGTAMSPLIDNGLVIVHVGDDRKGWVKAFYADTGKEKWTWEGDGPGYASPIVVTLEGTRQLVTLTDKSVIGVAVDSGRLLWKLPFPDEWNENIVTPVLYKRTLILSGVRKGTMAIQLVNDGDTWATKQLWHNPKVAMYMNSPVLEGDLLFGLSHLRKGQYFCLNAQTGETLWATDGREGQNAALISIANALIILTADGDLIVAKKSAKGFEQIARYDAADSATWSHPIAFGKKILIKDSSSLALWSIE